MPRETTPTPTEPRELNRTEKFLMDCRYAALVLGHVDERAAKLALISRSYEGNPATSLVYRDRDIEIVVDPDSLSMVVEYLKDGNRYNPIVSMLASGEVIRCHGEHLVLLDHAAQLAARAAQVNQRTLA